MSSGNDPLAILAQEREHILLAELAALLHNIGKLSIAFLAYQRCKACQEYHLTPQPEDQVYKLYNYQAVSGVVAEYITDPGTLHLTRQDWE